MIAPLVQIDWHISQLGQIRSPSDSISGAMSFFRTQRSPQSSQDHRNSGFRRSSRMADTPAQRIFGTPEDSAVADDELASAANSPAAPPNRRPSRISFTKRTSFSRWRTQTDEEMGDGGGGTPLPPPIPSALQQSNESTSTPLPMLSMIVLSIVRALLSYYVVVPDSLMLRHYWANS